ncbi:conserved Plasmodium protein, unknown function [Plasmodium yoelii]|uniref:Generative cell specific-1/HAP2 domain-containing protein n=1 Tax=Plasmodium yoelii TaxID=5861 RepID=A0A4V0KI98_PLAYE|nr:conserved Plasmodium protein, unknown function [Plasmodium yoelii]VTZ76472.1 conserved Plasmodium protein, unknown function [Plasmodium yoelii]|eukprot:XP_034493457.1 conserved Plasmodium protein, unknown function [Plasmodium yoelii]
MHTWVYCLFKQRFVIRRSEESAYKNFLLYVEEIYKSTVIYPIKYIYDVPLGYFENLISYKKEDLKNKNLKEFCENQKQLYENKDGNQLCFCCYCTQSSIFPLYSKLKYRRKKLLCNKKDNNENVILTLSCLKKKAEKYHGFYVHKSSNFFMLNVTMQQFDLNNELFINRNIKPELDRKTYLLNSSTFEIDDEIFNIKISFDVEKTHQGNSIEGNYIFMDSEIFKEKINFEDTYIDDEILKKSVIVKSRNLDDKGNGCNKINRYPIIWEKEKGFCSFPQNYCLKKQLAYFINMGKKNIIDKQNLAKQRHKKLIEYEKLFLKELHKGHKKRLDEINEKKKKKKKLKNRKEIKIRETDKRFYQKGERNKNQQQKKDHMKRNENQKQIRVQKIEKKIEKKKICYHHLSRIISI